MANPQGVRILNAKTSWYDPPKDLDIVFPNGGKLSNTTHSARITTCMKHLFEVDIDAIRINETLPRWVAVGTRSKEILGILGPIYGTNLENLNHVGIIREKHSSGHSSRPNELKVMQDCGPIDVVANPILTITPGSVIDPAGKTKLNATNLINNAAAGDPVLILDKKYIQQLALEECITAAITVSIDGADYKVIIPTKLNSINGNGVITAYFNKTTFLPNIDKGDSKYFQGNPLKNYNISNLIASGNTTAINDQICAYILMKELGDTLQVIWINKLFEIDNATYNIYNTTIITSDAVVKYRCIINGVPVIFSEKDKTTYICPGNQDLLNRSFINTIANELYNHNSSVIKIIDNVIDYIITKLSNRDYSVFDAIWTSDTLIIAIEILSQYRSILILLHDKIRLAMQTYTTVPAAKEYIGLCHFNLPFVKKSNGEFKIYISFRSFLNRLIPESSTLIMFNVQYFTAVTLSSQSGITKNFPIYSTLSPISAKGLAIRAALAAPVAPAAPVATAGPAVVAAATRASARQRRGSTTSGGSRTIQYGGMLLSDLKNILAGVFHSCRRHRKAGAAGAVVSLGGAIYLGMSNDLANALYQNALALNPQGVALALAAASAGATAAGAAVAAAAGAAGAGAGVVVAAVTSSGITQFHINSGINAVSPTESSVDDTNIIADRIDFIILDAMIKKSTMPTRINNLAEGELYCYIKEYFPEIFTYAIQLATAISPGGRTPEDIAIADPVNKIIDRYLPVPHSDDNNSFVKAYYWTENNVFVSNLIPDAIGARSNKDTARAILLADALITYYPSLKRLRLTTAIDMLKTLLLDPVQTRGKHGIFHPIIYTSLPGNLNAAVPGYMSGGGGEERVKDNIEYSDEHKIELDVAIELYELHYSRLIKSAYTDIETDKLVEERLITILTYDKSISKEYSKDEDYKYRKSRIFELIMDEYSSLPEVREYVLYISDDFDRVIAEFIKVGKKTETLSPLDIINKMFENNPELQANTPPPPLLGVLATGSASHEGGSRFRNLKYTRKTRRKQRKTRTTRVRRSKRDSKK